MRTNKILSLLAALLLAISPAFSLAEETAGIDAKLQTVRNNTSYTRESYETVWITPVFDEYIINGLDLEKYPSRFISFPAPEGAALTEFKSDNSIFIDTDGMLTYFYAAYDRLSFEVFLEKAEEENTVRDGSDGVAIFVNPDSRRGNALIDLKPDFEKTPKLEILIVSHDRSVDAEKLKELIIAETERVQAAMKIEDTQQFWSQGVYNSIEISASRSTDYRAVVNVVGKTVTRFDGSQVVTKEADGRNVASTEIKIDSYSYPHSKEENGDEGVTEAALADGTPYKMFQAEFSSYASFTLLEKGSYDSIYLTIKIDCDQDSFAAALEEAYARIALTTP